MKNEIQLSGERLISLRQAVGIFGRFSIDSSDVFRLFFPDMDHECVRLCVWGVEQKKRKFVQLIWLAAQLSSLHISLQTNNPHPIQSKVSEVKHTTDS